MAGPTSFRAVTISLVLVRNGIYAPLNDAAALLVINIDAQLHNVLLRLDAWRHHPSLERRDKTARFEMQ